ncbi:MAG: type II toxin-antitoxin system HicB family antitoxin [Phycisphaerales bacterium]|nr:type II toxin-antitoxin system HicB family antitoxin [Phycisphaerales bacterium]MCB9840948.1 type II toxin-antitoxin system HicB family antitoxin [Phycisphaeraceae bacterium]
MATHRYTVIFEREEDGGYHVFCPTLPGCHSQGDTLDEAVENIREAIALFVESLEAHGEPIPREDLLIKSIEIAA